MIDISSLLLFGVAYTGVFVVAAKRTPFGAFGGKLTNFSATDLGEVAAKAALASGNIDPELVGSTVVGNVAQVSIIEPLGSSI